MTEANGQWAGGSGAVEHLEADVLVIGGGLAGLRAATAARAAGASVVMAYHGRGASQYIIGFNAPIGHADARDGPEVFYEDTMAGGYRLNDPALVRQLAEGAVPALLELEEIGVPFARDGTRFAQRLLSGNRYPRSVYHPEGVGRHALDRLAPHARALGVTCLPGCKALTLLMGHAEVAGALLAEVAKDRLIAVHAKATVLATGGVGAIYADSTYPADVAADSFALAHAAGAELIDMEFIQFEPTVVVHPAGCQGMEMPTAMLGDGAHLKNRDGERFMFRYNPSHGELQIEKARMALAIQDEIDAGRGLPDGTVLFDTCVLSPDKRESYAGHCRRLRAAGLDPAVEAPRVRPAAHSVMGGIRVDASLRATVANLFAAGESAGGVHGASRLAGNGAADVIVFGGIAGKQAAAHARNATQAKRDRNALVRDALAQLPRREGTAGAPSPDEIASGVRTAMFAGVGLRRRAEGLARTAETLESLSRSLAGGLALKGARDWIRAIGAASMVATGLHVTRSALVRQESRGAHQRTDHPAPDDESWLQHVIVTPLGTAVAT